jgi:iron complex transport system permease protein
MSTLPRLSAPAWAALALLPVAAVSAAVLFGSAVGPIEALRWIAGLPTSETSDAILRTVVVDVRLPRALLLALAGAAFAVGGAVLQSCLQNPLADPSLLGLSGGASLGAVAAYTSGAALAWPASVPLAAFAGALLAITIVYVAAYAAGRPTTGALLLTGVAVSSLCSSLVSILLIAEGGHRVHEIFAWLLGSADRSDWQLVRLAVIPVLAGLAGLVLLRRMADALALGEEHALSVGVDVLRGRAILLALVALAAGSAVSAVGPIAFVGLMVPHMVRPLAGPAARALLPACAVVGAGFLVLCDLLARVASQSFDLPVGIVTALMGVPFFLVLLHRVRARQ